MKINTFVYSINLLNVFNALLLCAIHFCNVQGMKIFFKIEI